MQEIKIEGVIALETMTHDEFLSEFHAWLSANCCTFGGITKELDKEGE